MSALRNYLNKIKPNFEEGGKLHAFRSVFDGFETFLYVPNDTAKAGGVNIHDAIDSKRIMSMVVIGCSAKDPGELYCWSGHRVCLGTVER